MRVFGTKQIEPTSEDVVAAARLSAVAARYKGETWLDPTEGAAGDEESEPSAGAEEPDSPE